MNRDALIQATEELAHFWQDPALDHSKVSNSFLSTFGKEEIKQREIYKKFSRLPEVVQLMISINHLSDKDLFELAQREGYLDKEEIAFLDRNILIAIIAGSINRGATAESTGLYKTAKTNTSSSSRWVKAEG